MHFQRTALHRFIIFNGSPNDILIKTEAMVLLEQNLRLKNDEKYNCIAVKRY